jgi:hypothetical protein
MHAPRAFGKMRSMEIAATTAAGTPLRVLMVCYHFPPMSSTGSLRVARFARYLPPDIAVEVLTVANPPEETGNRALLNELAGRVTIHKAALPARLTQRWVERLFTGVPLGSLMSKALRTLLTFTLWIPDWQVLWRRPALHLGGRLLGSGAYDLIFCSSPPHSLHLTGLELKRRFGRPAGGGLPRPVVGQPRPALADRSAPPARAPARAAGAGRRRPGHRQHAGQPRAAAGGLRRPVAGEGGRAAERLRPGAAPGPCRPPWPARATAGGAWSTRGTCTTAATPSSARSRRSIAATPTCSGAVVFRFVGSLDAGVAARAAELQAAGLVETLSFVSAERVPDEIAAADALLYVVPPAGRHWIPSKLYDYFLAEKPIIGVLPRGDAWDWLERSGLGTLIEDTGTADVTRGLPRLPDAPAARPARGPARTASSSAVRRARAEPAARRPPPGRGRESPGVSAHRGPPPLPSEAPADDPAREEAELRRFSERCSAALEACLQPDGTLLDPAAGSAVPDDHYAATFTALAFVLREADDRGWMALLGRWAGLPAERRGHAPFNRLALLLLRDTLQRRGPLAADVALLLARSLDACQVAEDYPSNNWVLLARACTLLEAPAGPQRATAAAQVSEALGRWLTPAGGFIDGPSRLQDGPPSTPITYHAKLLLVLLVLRLGAPDACLESGPALARGLAWLLAFTDESGRSGGFGRSSHALYGYGCVLALCAHGLRSGDERSRRAWAVGSRRTRLLLESARRDDGLLSITLNPEVGAAGGWDDYMHLLVYNAWTAGLAGLAARAAGAARRRGAARAGAVRAGRARRRAGLR